MRIRLRICLRSEVGEAVAMRDQRVIIGPIGAVVRIDWEMARQEMNPGYWPAAPA
jgi:hypothetical protein